MKENSKVGTAIITYNRFNLLKRLINQFFDTITMEHDLIVSDDGSNDNTISFLEENGINFIHNEINEGIVSNKNNAFRYLKNRDFIFIIEDDVLLLNSGWDSLYINALDESKLHHLTFIQDNQHIWDSNIKEKIKLIKEVKYGNFIFQYMEKAGHFFSIYSGEVIRAIGGMHPKFKGYGFEHDEHQHRLVRFGFQSHPYIHLKSADLFISHDESITIKDKMILKRRKLELKKNKQIFLNLMNKPPKKVLL